MRFQPPHCGYDDGPDGNNNTPADCDRPATAATARSHYVGAASNAGVGARLLGTHVGQPMGLAAGPLGGAPERWSRVGAGILGKPGRQRVGLEEGLLGVVHSRIWVL